MRPAPATPFPYQAWALVGLYFAIFSLVALWKPRMWFVVGGMAALQIHFYRADARRWRERSASRRGEDIGTFARAFDRKGGSLFDPRVVRATWDALAVELEPGGSRVPVRPVDDLEQDFEIEYVEVLATAIAQRAGRSPVAWQVEPSLLDHVRTVADLVQVVTRQPSV
jgi:hypothetical protein